MSAETTRSRRLVMAFFVAVLIGGGALIREMSAFNPQPDPPFGMVGIADGQTARLNLVNLGKPDPLTGAIPPPCRARLQFADSQGNVLATRDVAPRAGRAAFLDFVPDFAPPINTVGDIAPLLRAEIRAVVTFDDGTLAPPCRVTAELFDNATGRTSILYPPPCRGAACRIGQ